MSRKNIESVLSLKQRVPKGEYLEEFLRENGLWESFKSSSVRRRYDDESLALDVFVRKEGLEEEFQKFRDARIVGIRLGDRAVNES